MTNSFQRWFLNNNYTSTYAFDKNLLLVLFPFLKKPCQVRTERIRKSWAMNTTFELNIDWITYRVEKSKVAKHIPCGKDKATSIQHRFEASIWSLCLTLLHYRSSRHHRCLSALEQSPLLFDHPPNILLLEYPNTHLLPITVKTTYP